MGRTKIRTPATIVIPTYNGRAMLARCLDALLQDISACETPHKIIVVDDASADGTDNFLAENYPLVDVLRLKKSGFGRACNSGVMQAQTDIVVLLNNDIVIEPGFLNALIEPFKTPDVFAVGAKFLSGEGSLDFVLGNRTRGVWKRGLIEIYHETNAQQLTEQSPQLFAQGGGMACRRDIFINLGGFDTLFEPFYWEDVDLSYRAWKRGWKVLFEPKAVCRHYQSQTTERDFKRRYLELTSRRNSYLFLWKNLTERRMFARHLASIPKRAAQDVLIGGSSEFAALVAAIERLRQAAARRAVERTFSSITDQEVLRLSHD